jgi:prephenate dehydrogenase
MDVASLQAPALDVAEAVDLARRYVSAHPLAGSEASGFAAARESLYDGVPVSLSVASSLAPDAADRLLLRSRWLWSEVGARPVMEDAGVHDARMALVSHLPQLVSNALARVLQTRGVEPGALGPGGMDMTRLAASSPEMWGDLLPYTGRRVGAALRALSAQAERLAAAVERGDMEPVEEIMQATRAWRRR